MLRRILLPLFLSLALVAGAQITGSTNTHEHVSENTRMWSLPDPFAFQVTSNLVTKTDALAETQALSTAAIAGLSNSVSGLSLSFIGSTNASGADIAGLFASNLEARATVYAASNANATLAFAVSNYASSVAHAASNTAIAHANARLASASNALAAFSQNLYDAGYLRTTLATSELWSAVSAVSNIAAAAYAGVVSSATNAQAAADYAYQAYQNLASAEALSAVATNLASDAYIAATSAVAAAASAESSIG